MTKIHYKTPGALVTHRAPGRMTVRVPSPMNLAESFSVVTEKLKIDASSTVYFDVKRALNIYLRYFEQAIGYPGRLEYLGIVHDDSPYLECYTEASNFIKFMSSKLPSMDSDMFSKWLHRFKPDEMTEGEFAEELFAGKQEPSPIMGYWFLQCCMDALGLSVDDVLRKADTHGAVRIHCTTTDADERATAVKVTIESPLDFDDTDMDFESDVRVWVSYPFDTQDPIKKALYAEYARVWNSVRRGDQEPCNLVFDESRWASEYVACFLSHCGVPEWEIKFEGVNHSLRLAAAIIPRMYMEDWLKDLRSGKLNYGADLLRTACIPVLEKHIEMDFTPIEVHVLLDIVLQHKNKAEYTPDFVEAKLLNKNSIYRYMRQVREGEKVRNCYIDVSLSNIEYDVDFEEDLDLLQEGAPSELQEADGETLYKWQKDNGAFPDKMEITILGLYSDLEAPSEEFLETCVDAISDLTGWCVSDATIEKCRLHIAKAKEAE